MKFTRVVKGQPTTVQFDDNHVQVEGGDLELFLGGPGRFLIVLDDSLNILQEMLTSLLQNVQGPHSRVKYLEQQKSL